MSDIMVNPLEMFGSSRLFNIGNSSTESDNLMDLRIDLRTLITLGIIIGLATYGIVCHNETAIFASLIGVLIYVN